MKFAKNKCQVDRFLPLLMINGDLTYLLHKTMQRYNLLSRNRHKINASYVVLAKFA